MSRKLGFVMVAVVLAVVLAANTGFAVEKVKPAKVLRPTAFGITPPVSELPAPAAPEVKGENHEIPNPEARNLAVLPGATATDQVMGESFISPDSGVLAPSPTMSFDANNSDDNAALFGYRLAPPDTQGAVGMQYWIQFVNVNWSIYDKSSGAEVVGPLASNSLWAAGIPGTDCATFNDGDPITLYDSGAQRWFMSQLAYEGAQYRACMAVSETSDPTGAWYVWQYDYSASILNDYPKFGVWPDGYYMTVNEFGGGDPATTVFDRTAMLAGDANPAAQYFFIAGLQPAFPLPSNWNGGPPPPAGSPNYNMAFYDDAWGNPADILQICELTIDWGTPANSAFTCPAGEGDPGYIDLTAAGLSFDSDLCGYSRNCIPQPNGQTVDTLSDRLMQPLNYRNLMDTKGYEVMTVTHSVDVDGSDWAGVRWYELRNTGSGWFIYDGGTFAPDSDDRWMGSAAVDQEGNIGIIYSISSSTTYPSVGYTARLATDPAGSMQTEQLLVAGAGSQSGVNRWGDYAAMFVDPAGCTFWGTAEYAAATGNYDWDTYVGSFSMPGCTPSGFGTVEGTVVNLNTMGPIEGALIEVGPYTTYSQADGTYGINVPADTYDVTASAFGYAPMTANGVVVPDGDSVIQDFELEPVGSAFLDGYVTDAGHGWPLYAMIDIATGGSTVATVFTDPFNGYYEIELPQGAAYDLTVMPYVPGYDPQMRGIVLAPAGQTESFVFMPSGAQGCVAPGYAIGNLTGVASDFEGGFPPAGFTIVNHGGACDWNTNTFYGRTNYAGSGTCADADSDACGSGTTMNTSMYTPVMDLSGVVDPTIDFLAAYNYLSGDYFDVNISTDGGGTWTNLLHWTSDHAAYGPGEAVSLDISAYATATTMVEFHFYSPGWNWWAEIDDVEIGDPADIECVPIPGAMAIGFVADANTGEAINGAMVTNDIGGEAETGPTPDDPNLPDGAWGMFVPLPLAPDGPSTRTFTASAANYADSMVTINLVPDTVNQIDFALDAGWLEMTPHEMSIRLYDGQTYDEPMAVLNYGGIPANVQMLAFEKAGWVPNLPMDEIAAPAVAPGHLNDHNARAVTIPEREAAQPLAAGDVIQTWATGQSLPWGVGFEQYGNKVWLANPYTPTTDFQYETDGTPTGNTIDLSGWVGSWAGDLTFDSTSNMLWQVNVGGDNCIYELDPVGLVSTGNSICWGASTSERGVAYDPVSDTFFVGGWNTLAITRFDRSGTVLQVANVGLSISGLAYNPVTEHLFVMENSPTDTVTVLDPNDNYNTIGTFTIPGYGNYAGAGLGISCDGHLWAANQGDGMMYEVDSGESGACLGAALPWMIMTPDSGEVPPASPDPGMMPMNAQFIADGAPHWGLVQATVSMIHDTPYPVNDMTVCFTKAFSDVAPDYWADEFIHALAGARISTGCGYTNFCPDANMTRGVMARWLITSMYGADYSPPQCVGIFQDVICEDTPNADYIEALYNEGVTAGCNADPLQYCPDSPVTRSEMAVFLLAALEGADYVPPACTGIFGDVPCPTYWAADWIEDLYNRGITAGCSANPLLYCPNSTTSRAEMSVFETATFGFPMCDMDD